MYVELHSRSAFSFLEGSSIPEELVAVCANLGMPGIALLDRDGVYGSPRFHLAAKKAEIKAHIGAEVTFKGFSFLQGDTHLVWWRGFAPLGRGRAPSPHKISISLVFVFRFSSLRALDIKISAA